jgi:hypothetical protein
MIFEDLISLNCAKKGADMLVELMIIAIAMQNLELMDIDLITGIIANLVEIIARIIEICLVFRKL